jgi:hypothetical protein
MNVDTYMHLTDCLLLCRCLGSLLRSRATPAFGFGERLESLFLFAMCFALARN